MRLKGVSLLKWHILCSTILPILTSAMTTLIILATLATLSTLFRRQVLISIQSSRIIDFVSQYTSYLLHTGVFLPPSQHSLDTLSTHTMRVLPEAGDSEQGTALVRVYLSISKFVNSLHFPTYLESVLELNFQGVLGSMKCTS